MPSKNTQRAAKMASARSAKDAPADDVLDLVTVEEFAEILKTSPSSLYSAKSRGQLPPSARINGRVMWQRSVVKQWVAEKFAAAGASTH